MKFLAWLLVVALVDHFTGAFSSIAGMPAPPTQMIQQTINQPPCPQQPWTDDLQEI